MVRTSQKRNTGRRSNPTSVESVTSGTFRPRTARRHQKSACIVGVLTDKRKIPTAQKKAPFGEQKLSGIRMDPRFAHIDVRLATAGT